MRLTIGMEIAKISLIPVPLSIVLIDLILYLCLISSLLVAMSLTSLFCDVAVHLITHVRELGLIFSLEVPVDAGRGGHLAPHLTGDAAQFEAFHGNGLCVRVQLHAGSVAQRRCRAKRMKSTQLETSCITSLGGQHPLFHVPVTWGKGCYKGRALLFFHYLSTCRQTV